MIKHFKHKGLQAFFETGSRAGIRPDHAGKLARQLRQLNDARGAREMNMPGWRLHPLLSSLDVADKFVRQPLSMPISY